MNSGRAKDLKSKILDEILPNGVSAKQRKVVMKTVEFKKTYKDALKQYKSKSA